MWLQLVLFRESSGFLVWVFIIVVIPLRSQHWGCGQILQPRCMSCSWNAAILFQGQGGDFLSTLGALYQLLLSYRSTVLFRYFGFQMNYKSMTNRRNPLRKWDESIIKTGILQCLVPSFRWVNIPSLFVYMHRLRAGEKRQVLPCL